MGGSTVTSLAEKVFTTAERLQAYDALTRQLIPGLDLEFRRATAQMKKAMPAASDPNGSLKDLATFIIAARASENAQCALLAAEKIARQMHPMSKARFGK
jgi:hypothetical protein